MEAEKMRKEIARASDELLDHIRDSYATRRGWNTARKYIHGLMSGAERKNGWQLSEQLGEHTPYMLQQFLYRGSWDADRVRNQLRGYVCEHLGEEDGVLVVDETGFLKQGQEIVSKPQTQSSSTGPPWSTLILGGMRTKDLSQYCGGSVRTINTWVKKVDEKGWSSLMTVKQTGRPMALSDTQLEEIKQAVSNDPENYGYHVWDGPTLSDCIEATYSIEYGTRACQKLFHRLGFSLLRPQTYPSLENPDCKARNELKKQQNMSENPDIIPVFQEEIHFQAQTGITRAWAPKGSKPKVMSKPGKNNIAYIGFVIPATGELYVTKPGWFNYESVIRSFRDFIKANPVPDGKKYCMILDNAPWLGCFSNHSRQHRTKCDAGG